MSESNVQSLVLLSTGRRSDMVNWEIQNQAALADTPLISFCRLSRTAIRGDVNHIGIAADTDEGGSKRKVNEVLFRATFDCQPARIGLLKDAIANCILIRSAYEDEVTSALGIDQLWGDLNRMGMASIVESKPAYSFNHLPSLAIAASMNHI